MDDFERGAREMQRVAAEAMEAIVAQENAHLSAISKGLDHALWARIYAKRNHFLIAAETIRSISIEGAINAVVGDER